MSKKTFSAGKTVAKMRQIEVLASDGKALPQSA